MDFTEHKQAILRHCCWMAEIDPAYAIWAAREYERRSHGVLLNLKRKVEQHIRRMNTPTNPPEGEPDGI